MIMNRRANLFIACVPFILLLSACFGTISPEDEIATQVAVEQSVAATLTADAIPASEESAATVASDTPIPIAQATATPTKVVVAILPTDTPIPTDTPTYTPEPTLAPTEPPEPTNTSAPLPTSTSTSTPTLMPTPMPTLMPTPMPTPTPTKIVAVPVPIDGGADSLVASTDPSNGARNILLPGFLPNEISSPMIFRGRIGLALSIYSINAAEPVAGAGVEEVTFFVTDLETGDIVYENSESTSLYCLFGGNTLEECRALTFAEMNNQWPDGSPIYNGEYRIDMEIETDDDNGNWNFSFFIEGAQERAESSDTERSGADFSGRWVTNAGIIEFQQSGSAVLGSYQLYGDSQQYTIEGTVTGNVLEGTYTGYDGGTVSFGLSPDGQRFDGSWFYQGQGAANHWCGVRSGPLWDGCGYSGHWESIGDYVPNYPPTMNLIQNGNTIEGTFFNGVSNNPGTIVGQVGTEGVGSQLTAVGRWSIDSASGTFRWRLNNLQSAQFIGRSTTADGQPHQWCGWRSGQAQPEPCLE